MGAPGRMTTSTIGMYRKNNNAEAAFTLVELILVMVVLCTILALVAPTLSHSFRQRNLEQEATRLLALTEYGRDEAVSQGVPALVWIDPAGGSFGVEAAPGYTDTSIRQKNFTLPENLHFDVAKTRLTDDGMVQLVQFSPDGTPDTTALDAVGIVDQNNDSSVLRLSDDGWNYEIVKEGNATRKR